MHSFCMKFIKEIVGVYYKANHATCHITIKIKNAGSCHQFLGTVYHTTLSSTKYIVLLNEQIHSLIKVKDEPPHDKTNKVSVCPAKTQISLGIRPV